MARKSSVKTVAAVKAAAAIIGWKSAASLSRVFANFAANFSFPEP